LLSGLFAQDPAVHFSSTFWASKVSTTLNGENAFDLIDLFNTLFHLIPYQLYASVERRVEDLEEIFWLEAFYHQQMQVALWCIDIAVRVEVSMAKGRTDLVIERKGHIWILELKVSLQKVDSSVMKEAGKKLAATALAQIHDRNYHLPYLHQGKKVILVGIGIINRQAYQVSEMME